MLDQINGWNGFTFWIRNLVPTKSEITAVKIKLSKAALKTPEITGILVRADISSITSII